MSDTAAAATLSLEINTNGAEQKLAALTTQYTALREGLGKQIPAEGLTKVDEALAALRTELAGTTAAIDHLTKTSRSLGNGDGAKEFAAAYSHSMSGLSHSVKVAAADTEVGVKAIEAQLVGLAESTRALGNQQLSWSFKIDRNFAGEVTAEAQKAFEASVQYDRAWVEAHGSNQALLLTEQMRFGDAYNALLAEQSKQALAFKYANLEWEQAQLQKASASKLAAQTRFGDEFNILLAEQSKQAEVFKYANLEWEQGQLQKAAAAKLASQVKFGDEFNALLATQAKEALSHKYAHLEWEQKQLADSAAQKLALQTKYGDEFNALLAKQAQDALAFKYANLEWEQEQIRKSAAQKLIAQERLGDEIVALMARQAETQLALERKYILMSEQQRLKAAIDARKLMDAGYAGNMTSQFAPQTINTASAGNLAALTRQHNDLASSTAAGSAAQIHWNEVSNEGHAVARGLSGSLGTLWMTYGAIIPLLAGAALGAGFLSAAKAGSDFAYQLTFVKALSQETSGAIDLLSKSTLSLSKSSMQGPNDIASGYRILAQAGLDVTSSIATMPHVLHLATVGEMGMEEAAVTLVGVMNAFGMSVGNVEHIGDVFAKAAALSQTSVVSMTSAMKTASVVGEQYGASMEDTATAITLLAKVNIVGTSAGTAYRNMLKELYAPVPAAALAMQKLGIETKDSMGNMKPFADVIYELKGKLESFGKADKVQILQRLFGERGAKEAIAMMALTKDKWIELRDAISNSDGFMSGVAKELEDTAKGRWAIALNTMKSSLITAFADMEPAFKDLADSFKNLFSDPKFVDGLKTMVGAMLSMTAVIIEMAPALITLAEAWLILKSATISVALWNASSAAVTGYVGAMTAASGAMGPVALGASRTSALLGLLPASFAAMLNPIGLVVGGLAAAGVAFYLFRDHTADAMESSSDKIQTFGGEAKKVLDEVARTLNSTSTAMSSTRLSVGETALVAMNERLDDDGKTLSKKYGINGIDEARKTVQDATTTNSTGETYTSETDAFRASQAFVKAYEIREKRAKQFYQLQEDLRVKNENEERLTAQKLADAGKPPHRNASEILDKADRTALAAEKSAAVEEFRNAEKMARAQYDTEKKITNELYKDKLISESEFTHQRTANEELYLATVREAERDAYQSLNRKGKAEKQGQRDAIEVEKDKITNRIAEQSWMDSINEREQMRLSLIKQQSESRTFQHKVIPKEVAKLDVKYQTAWDQRDVPLMEPRAAAEFKAREDVAQSFRQITAAKEDDLKVTTQQLAAQEKMDEALNSYSAATQFLRDKQALLQSDLAAAAAAMDKEGNSAAQLAGNLVDHSRTFEAGWGSAFRSYADNATNAANTGRQVFSSMSKAMEDSIVQFVTTGKVNFKSLANTMLAEAARTMASKAVSGMLGSISGLVLSMFSGGGENVGGGTTVANTADTFSQPVTQSGVIYSRPLMHSGGIVGTGEGSGYRSVQSALFDGAHKYHTGGIAGNEVPTILQKGEGVFTAGQMKALGGGVGGGNVTISIVVNKDGTSKDASAGDDKGAWTAFAGRVREMIISEMTTQKRPGGLLYG